MTVGDEDGVIDDPRRRLPSLDSLLARPEVDEWCRRWGRRRVTDTLREAVEESRASHTPGDVDTIVPRARELLHEALRPGLRRVINGTGVVQHTNLGRAPLSVPALEAIARLAAG